MKIKDAAEAVGIGYENAKQILKVFNREGRKHTLLFKNKPDMNKPVFSTSKHDYVNRIVGKLKVQIKQY